MRVARIRGGVRRVCMRRERAGARPGRRRDRSPASSERSAGADVPGATVTATQRGRRRTRASLVSSSAGVYTAAGLRPGGYRVDVQLAGLQVGCGATASTSRPARRCGSTSTLEVGGSTEAGDGDRRCAAAPGERPASAASSPRRES